MDTPSPDSTVKEKCIPQKANEKRIHENKEKLQVKYHHQYQFVYLPLGSCDSDSISSGYGA